MQTGTTPSLNGGKMNAAVTKELGLSAMFGDVAEVQIGEYIGTGVLLNVPLDFDPTAVLIFDLTGGVTVGLAINTASRGTKAAKITGAGVATVAANGVGFGAAGQRKLTIGTDASLNTAASVYQFVAFGS